MTRIAEILRSDAVHCLGWVLLHSLWQIALLASILAVMLAALRRRAANLQYLIACAGLALMCFLPVVTYCVVAGQPVPERAAIAVSSGPPRAVSVDALPPSAGPLAAAWPSALPPERSPGPLLQETVSPGPTAQPIPSAEPAAPLPERVARALRPWMPGFVMAWLIGVFSLSMWRLGGWFTLEQLKHLGTTPCVGPWTQRLAELIERMPVSRPVRMLQSAMVDGPAVIGWLRPVLLVPAGMLGELSSQQIEAILAHELAHIRRCDYLVNLLQTVAETLLFYHPAVWWLSRRIRIERENCCDDAAVAVCGSRVDYAATLMAMERSRMTPRLAMAAGRTGRDGTALSRVRRVLNVSGRDPVRPQTWVVGAFAAVTLLGLLAGYVATAGERPQIPKEKAPEEAADEATEAGQGPGEPANLRPDPQRPWSVFGRVTDGQGRPLEGVELRANCGMGTLMLTGKTVTDKQGNYTLRFGPGISYWNKTTRTWGAGIQVATIFAFKPGYPEKNLCRQGDLLMGDKLPAKRDYMYSQRDRIVLPNKPRRVDFTMVVAATLEGELVGAQGKPIADKQISVEGKQMLPSTSVLAQTNTDKQGRFRFEGIPPNYAWWFTTGERGRTRTQPITFPGPGTYRVKLQLVRYPQYNLDVFRITSVTDPQGAEVRDRVVGDDPAAGPPVSEDLQEKGRWYLGKMAAACRDWLGPPPAEVRNYEYRFRLGDDPPKTYRVDDPSRAPFALRQGITYFGTPHVLASRREKVVFRQVEVGRETILLRFLVQDSVGIAAGNGISGTWRGYFSGSLREGLLVLDKTTYRPVRTDLGDVHESFAQYMDLGDGRFAPLAIQIEQGGTTWDWKFRIYQPGLWLLAESRQRDWEGRGEPLVIVDQVKVNGQPAVPMAQDRAPTKPKPPTEASRADDWGPAVDGVQCRLEGKKPTWKAAEMPTLRAYVRHQAETRLFLSNHPMFGAQLEVDGHWHRWNGSLEWAGPAHSSSKFRTKDEQPLAITLDENWQQVENKQRLRMDPGRHVVRFAWEGHPERAPREGPDEQRSVVLMSNPVRITILPERPQPKPADLHPDERAAAAALQQLGAILAAGDQGRIRSVRLSRTAVTDADLLHLKKLSGLKALYLDDTRITDAGLAHLAGLTGLETLSLNYTRIGDAGLEHLKTLSQLRSLELLETAVTAAGLRSLRKALPALQARVDPLKLSGLGDLRAWRNSAELNDDYELLSVDLLDANITDTALERLKDRRSLQDVCLFNTPITDAGLAHLQGLTDLHTLYLSNTRVTDAGLAYVEGMKKLKSLLLADTRVGDAGLRHLEGLSQLEFLRLSGTLVSDAGLAHLSALTNLTGLDLSNCQVSGAGLGHLRALTKLTSLALSGTAVADPGLIHVQPFENLELLYLSHTSVTDAGLEYLTGLKKLRGLEIEHTAVTDEGVKRLKLFLPNASIYR